MMEAKFIPYTKQSFNEDEMLKRSIDHLDYMDKRRTVRDFSSKSIPEQVIENMIMTASTAPSGAHKQPWTFCVVTNPELKSKIKTAAEEEEYESYNERMPKNWLEDLSYLGTDWRKPFLETAPALIIVFKKSYDIVGNEKRNNYYVTESVGLACGFLLETLHYCGLVALTHTPSPMNFLSKLLNRPENEKPFLLIPIGYPAENTMVPDLKRKEEGQVIQYFR
jgi:iodotyrosine deiodinase